ncbi:unnamed protein product [Lampetra fluviatilis]
MEAPEWTLPDVDSVMPVLDDFPFFFHQRGVPRVPGQVYRVPARAQGVPVSPRGAPANSQGPGLRAPGQQRRPGQPEGSPREEGSHGGPRESPTEEQQLGSEERFGFFSLQDAQVKRPLGDGWRGPTPERVRLLLLELGLVLDSVMRAGLSLPQGLRNIIQCSWPELSALAAPSTGAVGGTDGDGSDDGGGGGGTPEPTKLPDGRAEKAAPKNREAKAAVAAETGNRHRPGVVAPVPPRGDRARAKKTEASNPSPRSDAGAQSRSSPSQPGLPASVLSFSMSSLSLAIRGLLDEGFGGRDAQAWMEHCSWAVRRLQASLRVTDAESHARARAGASHPLILRRYGEGGGGVAGADSAKPAHLLAAPPLPAAAAGPAGCRAAARGRPASGRSALCAAVARAEGLLLTGGAAAGEAVGAQTLHCQLPDGSVVVYYPSGRVAVAQVPAGPRGAGAHTVAFADEEQRPALLATFTPDGRGFVFHAASPQRMAVMMNVTGVALCDAKGGPVSAWRWPRSGRAERPLTVPVGDFMTLRVTARHAVTLLFRCQQECVRLSVSPFSMAALDSPRAELHISRGQPEVKRFRQRIRSILAAWMEHYRHAVGVSAGLTARPRESTHRLQVPAPQPPPPPPPAQPAPSLPAPARAGPAPRGAATANRGGEEERGGAEVAVAVAASAASALSREDRGRQGRDDATELFLLSRRSRASPARTLPGIESGHVELACPVSLRAALGGRAPARPSAGQRCRCSARRVPSVTDVEVDALLRAAPCGGPRQQLQVVVVVVVDSAAGRPHHPCLRMVESLYEEKNRNRTAPCIQGRGDSFRLLHYDLSLAAPLPGPAAPLLARRHAVRPGMFLMYAAGRLLFADLLLDGYGVTRRDLRRQIARSRGDFLLGRFLPRDFRFSPRPGPGTSSSRVGGIGASGADDGSSASEASEQGGWRTERGELAPPRPFTGGLGTAAAVVSGTVRQSDRPRLLGV